MTSSSDWAIEAHALVKTFGSNRAVDGVDLSVRVGTIDGVPAYAQGVMPTVAAGVGPATAGQPELAPRYSASRSTIFAMSLDARTAASR